MKKQLHHGGILRIGELQKYSRRDLVAKLGISKYLAANIGDGMSRAGFHLRKDERRDAVQKSKHWIQTPEGREKMAMVMGNRNRKKVLHHSLPNWLHQTIIERLLKHDITTLAGLLDLSYTELTRFIGSYASIASATLKAHGYVLEKQAAKKQLADKPMLEDLPSKVINALGQQGLTKMDEIREFTMMELSEKIGHYFASIVSKKLRQVGTPLKLGKHGKRVYPQLTPEKSAPEPTPIPKRKKEKEDGGKEYLNYIVGFAHCDIQARIHQFAASSSGKVTEQDLSRRLGELLLGQEMR